MDIHGRPVLIYRWVTFLLAGGYCLYQLLSHDYSNPGGPFRFLTIWALFLSFYSASRMLALSERRIARDHQRTAMVTSVLNVMVVFLYWKLYLTDPSLVRVSGEILWHQEYYLHGLGPALQIFDALFIAQAFRRPWRAAPALLATITVYVLWIEFFVQRFNAKPVGSVTSGLPYPFLNSLDLSGRLTFYGSNLAVSLFVLAGLGLMCWVIRRSAHAVLSRRAA